jgi:hypothetical protein
MIVAAIAGCARSDSAVKSRPGAPDAAWLESRDSTAVRQLTLGASVCKTCIRLEKATELGKGDDPDGFIQHAFRIHRDAKGRYWLVQGSEIKLFDARGKFLRMVGSAGSGPGEWRSPWPATDSDGHIQIADPSNGRVTQLDGNFKVAAETPMPGLDINSIAPAGPNSFVINGWAVASDMIGEPIHVFENGRRVRSFGAGRPGVLNHFTGRRLVSGDGRGHVFLSKPYSFEIEAWTEKGERIIGASGPPLNRHEVLPAGYDFDRNPLPSEVRGIRLDSLGRLWVLTWHVKDDWKTKWEERVYPNGSKTLAPKAGGSPRDYRFSRIEVIDMAAGKIIAQVDVPQVLSGFVGSDEVWENPLPDADLPVITIWRIQPLGDPAGHR